MKRSLGHAGVPESPEIVLNRRTGSGNRPSNVITANCCDAWWTGLNSAHCAVCHQTFAGSTGFDMHRRNGECLDPAAMGFVPADKPWPGWSRPGTWTGPER